MYPLLIANSSKLVITNSHTCIFSSLYPSGFDPSCVIFLTMLNNWNDLSSAINSMLTVPNIWENKNAIKFWISWYQLRVRVQRGRAESLMRLYTSQVRLDHSGSQTCSGRQDDHGLLFNSQPPNSIFKLCTWSHLLKIKCWSLGKQAKKSSKGTSETSSYLCFWKNLVSIWLPRTGEVICGFLSPFLSH